MCVKRYHKHLIEIYMVGYRDAYKSGQWLVAALCFVFSPPINSGMLGFTRKIEFHVLNFQKSLFQSKQRVDLKNDISRISKMSVEELVRIASLILS